jgi:hypothetical protein
MEYVTVELQNLLRYKKERNSKNSTKLDTTLKLVTSDVLIFTNIAAIVLMDRRSSIIDREHFLLLTILNTWELQVLYVRADWLIFGVM